MTNLYKFDWILSNNVKWIDLDNFGLTCEIVSSDFIKTGLDLSVSVPRDLVDTSLIGLVLSVPSDYLYKFGLSYQIVSSDFIYISLIGPSCDSKNFIWTGLTSFADVFKWLHLQ